MRQWAIVLPPTPRPVIPCLPLPAPANGTGTHLGVRGPAARDAVIVTGVITRTRQASAGNAVPVRQGEHLNPTLKKMTYPRTDEREHNF